MHELFTNFLNIKILSYNLQTLTLNKIFDHASGLNKRKQLQNQPICIRKNLKRCTNLYLWNGVRKMLTLLRKPCFLYQ